MAKTKVRKRKINWREFIYEMHSRKLSDDYQEFVLLHPGMSKNRCAYYVLKKNYSTTFLQAWRDIYKMSTGSIKELMEVIKVNPYGV